MLGSPAAQLTLTFPSPTKGRARTRNEGLAHSAAFQAWSGIESHPAAIMSASAVFPEPRAPMMATKPGLSGITGVAAHGALRISIFEITCDGVADTGGSAPTCTRPAGSMHACLSASNSRFPLIQEK